MSSLTSIILNIQIRLNYIKLFGIRILTSHSTSSIQTFGNISALITRRQRIKSFAKSNHLASSPSPSRWTIPEAFPSCPLRDKSEILEPFSLIYSKISFIQSLVMSFSSGT